MKILLLANLDKNIGDDLMVKLVCENLLEHDIYLLGRNDDYLTAFNDLPNVKKTNMQNYLSFSSIKYIKNNFDLIIRVGGSIFQIRRPKQIFHYFKIFGFHLILKYLKVKTAIIGCNIGPIRYSLGKIPISLILKTSDLVTVRDGFSYRLASSANPLKTFFYPDIVLSLGNRKEILKFLHNPKEKCIGVSAYNLSWNPELNRTFREKMAELLDYYVDQTGEKVRLFAFNSGRENDIEAAKYIRNSMAHGKNAEIIEYTGEIFPFLSKISQCSKFIAVRFHSIILAMLFNIPILPIAYSSKSINFLKDLNYQRYIYLSDLVTLEKEEFAKRLFEVDKLFRGGDPSLFIKAEGHIKKLRNFVNNCERETSHLFK